MRLFVTGFTSSFVKVMLSQLKDLEILEVKSTTNRNSKEMFFDISTIDNFKASDYILHSGWNMEERSLLESEKINVQGTINFFESLSPLQKKNFIFVSTIAAYPETKSVYGSHKLKCEEYIITNGGRVIKLGILYEPNSNELKFLENIKSYANKLPVIPNFSGNKKIYKITNVENLQVYFNSINEQKPNTIYVCTEEQPISFDQLLHDILGINKLTIYFPLNLGYFIYRIINKIFKNLKINVDSFEYIRGMKKNDF